MKKERKRTKRVCPLCGAELGKHEYICHHCGACQYEPCYDFEDYLDE